MANSRAPPCSSLVHELLLKRLQVPSVSSSGFQKELSIDDVSSLAANRVVVTFVWPLVVVNCELESGPLLYRVGHRLRPTGPLNLLLSAGINRKCSESIHSLIVPLFTEEKHCRFV